MRAGPRVGGVPTRSYSLFEVGDARVLARSEEAARDLGWLLAEAARRFERASGRRPPEGVVLTFDLGEGPPGGRPDLWMYESVRWGARAVGREPPSIETLRREMAVVNRRARSEGVPNVERLGEILAGSRPTPAAVADVAKAAGQDLGDRPGLRWAAVMATPRLAASLAERAVEAGFQGMPLHERAVAQGEREEIRSALRLSLSMEMRGVLYGCWLLEEDESASSRILSRIARLEHLDLGG